MDLSNIFIASIILSILILIIMYVNFEMSTKDIIKQYSYIFIGNVIFLSIFKHFILLKHGTNTNTATTEIFKEIDDSKKINGVLMPNGVTGRGEDDLQLVVPFPTNLVI